MWTCPTCHEAHEDHFDACWRCASTSSHADTALSNAMSRLPMATMDTLPGYDIVRLCGVVTGLSIRSNGPGLDFEGELGSLLGGRQISLETALQAMRDEAVAAMVEEVQAQGGNAIVHVSIQYPSIHAKAWVVAVSGTAVVVRANDAIQVTTGETIRLA